MSSSERQVRVHRLISHLRSNLVGWIALFVALGGTGYAAIGIPRNSVGSAQLRNHSITPVKLNPKSIGGSVRAWAIVSSAGKVTRRQWQAPSRPCPESARTVLPSNGACASRAVRDGGNRRRDSPPTETYDPDHRRRQPRDRDPNRRIRQRGASTSPRASKHSFTRLTTFNQAGQPTPLGFDVAVIC